MPNAELLPHKILGVEFSPFFIPLARRLQTLAVFYWVLGFTIINTFGCVSLVWLLFFSKGYQWIALLYLSWVIYDWNTPETGGRRWKYTFCRNWFTWKYMKSYFPIELIKTADLSPEGKYLMCSHPHGVMCAGLQCAVGSDACGWSEKFKGLEARICTLPIQFTFLGWFRETALCGGAVSSSKSSMEYLFRKSKGIVTVLVPGGAFEARNWSKNEVKLYLLKRKGFIKLALRHGVDLVPSFSFNEQLIYKQISPHKGSFLQKLQDAIEKLLGFIPVIFFGRGIFNYTFGLLPYRKPINVVIGSPIKVKQVSSPSDEDIDRLHATYVEALKKLYEDHNPIYGNKDVKLLIE